MQAIGFLELNSIAKGVEAADAILKTADTDLHFAKMGCPGKFNILFTRAGTMWWTPWSSRGCIPR